MYKEHDCRRLMKNRDECFILLLRAYEVLHSGHVLRDSL